LGGGGIAGNAKPICGPTAGLQAGTELFMESLINSEIPATQGSVAIFDECNSLKMKESENRAFHFPCPEKSRMDLFRASLYINAFAFVRAQQLYFLLK
jgi:hypothetical protein